MLQYDMQIFVPNGGYFTELPHLGKAGMMES